MTCSPSAFRMLCHITSRFYQTATMIVSPDFSVSQPQIRRTRNLKMGTRAPKVFELMMVAA